MKPVSHYFTSDGHTTGDVATIVAQMTDNVNTRIHTEEVLIYLFQSRHPAGLNLIQ